MVIFISMHSEYIKVEQFEMKKANSPDILRSGGLGPCIAIGIYDSKTKSGYMMHGLDFQSDDLDGKIQEIKKDYGNLTELQIFAVGNSLDSFDNEEQREYEIINRPFVEQILRKYFQDSQLQIKWIHDDHCAELFLDTSTGEFELDIQSLDEMLE